MAEQDNVLEKFASFAHGRRRVQVERCCWLRKNSSKVKLALLMPDDPRVVLIPASAALSLSKDAQR